MKIRRKDTKARERAQNELDHSHIVEASAGTGKTTLLIDRILNLVIRKGARPEDIVAITFTERAAAELKTRLEQELARRLESSGDRDVRSLRYCLQHLEHMQVSTIHAFCSKLLRQRAVEARVDPGFEIADELEASLMAEEAWEEFLTERMEENDESIRYALLLGISLDSIKSLAFALAANRDLLDLLPQTIPIEQTLTQFKRKLRELATSTLGNPEMDVVLRSELGAIERLQGMLEVLAYIFRDLYIPVPSKRKANQIAPSHYAKLIELSEIHETLRRTIAHNAISRLAENLKEFLDRYQSLKSQRGVLDFHDLLLLTRNMLRDSPEVRQYFESHYKYLLVDEFQDTDPLQAEIVFYLSSQDGKSVRSLSDTAIAPGKLFLVGDPKQSIYRFRRADIEMYTSAKSVLPSSNHLSISTSFRSGRAIIDFVNSIFQKLICQPDDGAYQPDYVPLLPGRPPETCHPSPGVILIYPPKQLVRFPTTAERRIAESMFIAAFIRKAIDEEEFIIWDKHEGRFRHLAYKDIAILLRTHTPLRAIEDALRLYEIDYRIVGGKHFYLRQEVEDLIATLKAIENPYDTVALIRALRSPFFGLSDEDLLLFGKPLNYLADASGTPLEGPFALLRELRKQRNDISLDNLLDHLFEATGAHLTYLLKPGGEQRLANLKKIGEIGHALYERGIQTFTGIVKYLSQMQRIEAEEGEAPTVEGSDNFVRILTIHKAKGLEFPMVILCDLASPRYARETFIVDRMKSDLAIRMGKTRSLLHTANWSELSDFERKRSEAEEKRLLYVAFTRARDYLVVPCYWVSQAEVTKTGLLRKGSMLSYLAPFIPESASEIGKFTWAKGIMIYPSETLDTSRRFQPAFRVKIREKANKKDLARIEALKKRWLKRNEKLLTSLAKGTPIITATEVLKHEVVEEVTTGDGTSLLFGNIVHRLLELADWEVGKVEVSEASALLGDYQASNELISEATRVVNLVLSSDVIKHIRSRDYFKEVPFAYHDKGVIYEGKIDVIFCEDDGFSILDFKTEKIPGGKADEAARRYEPQLAIYSEALRRATGKAPKEAIIFFTHPLLPVHLEV